jgi:hypothetical protein
MDTASSGKRKAPTETQALAAGSPLEIPVKPRAIASELFNIQQRLFLVFDVSTVSISSHISQSPKMPVARDMGIQDFSYISF